MYCNEYFCGHLKTAHNAKKGCTEQVISIGPYTGKPFAHECTCYVSYDTDKDRLLDNNICNVQIGDIEIIL